MFAALGTIYRNTSFNSVCHIHRFPENNVRHLWEIFCGRDISHIKVPLICSHQFYTTRL